jgi:hypothetical protein
MDFGEGAEALAVEQSQAEQDQVNPVSRQPLQAIFEASRDFNIERPAISYSHPLDCLNVKRVVFNEKNFCSWYSHYFNSQMVEYANNRAEDRQSGAAISPNRAM